MSRLLSANFMRLRKSLSFWICLALTVIGTSIGFFSYYFYDRECVKHLCGLLISDGTSVMLVASVFTPLYLGAEYSNGTLRSKLVVGHTRAAVYFANFVTVLAAALIFTAANWLVQLAAGAAAGGSPGMEAEEFMRCAAVYLCALTALCAVNTLIGTLVASRSSTVVVTLVLMLGTLMISQTLIGYLEIPQYAEYWRTTETGAAEKIVSDKENPSYVGGVKRAVYTVFNNVLPCGSMCLLEEGTLPENGEALPLYSLGTAAVSTAIGAAAFRKKDLK